MSVVLEGIKINDNGQLCFGNYSVKEKQKVDNFDYKGAIYKVKTHDEITVLKKNNVLVIETVPGSAIHNFVDDNSNNNVHFLIEGALDTQITMELEPSKSYKIIIDDVTVGDTKSNMAGKINFSMELSEKQQHVKIEKL